MVSDETTAGSIATSDDQKREYAKKSHSWNLNNPQFLEHFCDKVEENKEQILKQQQQPTKQTIPSEKQSTTVQSDQPQETQPIATDKSGFSSTQKVICVCLIFFSWILASRILGDVNVK